MTLGKNSATVIAAALDAFTRMPDDAKMRPDRAAEYLQTVFGFGSAKTLAKHRRLGGGPAFSKAGANIVLYTKGALDSWARSKISAPVSSTSESPRAA
ncbi:hypothetical protein AMST5_02466 [freshwater sediment metagenome]|uniref:DNA-binding protein n=1 Tax=freshwater sediment metagenome TaxID=556182 RepID=A0AA48M2T8_9ZZZZ